MPTPLGLGSVLLKYRVPAIRLRSESASLQVTPSARLAEAASARQETRRIPDWGRSTCTGLQKNRKDTSAAFVKNDTFSQMRAHLDMAVNQQSITEGQEFVCSMECEAASKDQYRIADTLYTRQKSQSMPTQAVAKSQFLASQPSLRSIHTSENLQMLLDARPRQAPAGLIRANTLPISPGSVREHMAAKAAARSLAEDDESVAAGTSSGVPVFVMLPLDSVTLNGKFRYENSKWFARALASLVCTGVRGVAIDVWWGAVERKPGHYDFGGYRALFEAANRMGLKVQAVMSFHACGGNVGDSTQIPLPQWVLQAAEEDGDMFFCDRPRSGAPGGNVNREYISLFSDDLPALAGRSPLACYTDFMAAFATEFSQELGDSIEEVIIGSGPCGELRYPSYVEANGWRFPGVGEFQCYDRRALRSLAAAAEAIGHPEWGHGGPDDCGHYNSTPEETAFFRSWGGSWESEYGAFFLRWYSEELLAHGERLMAAAADVFLRGASTASSPASPPSSPPSSQPGRSSGDSTMSSASVLPSTGEEAASGNPGGLLTEKDASLKDDVIKSQGETTAVANKISAKPGAKLQRPYSAPTNLCRSNESSATSTGSTAGVVTVSQMRSAAPNLLPSQAEGSASQPQGSRQGQQPIAPAIPSSHREQVHVTMKVAGLHWWRHTNSRAAEATAGYWNTSGRDGYDDVIRACKRYGLSMTLTCVEMCDGQHPPAALCGPEGLLRQVREGAAAAGVALAGENALPCFTPNGVDATALDRIVYNTQAWAPPLQEYERAASASRDEAGAALASRAVANPGSGGGSSGSPAGDALSLSAMEGPSSPADSTSLMGEPSNLSRPASNTTFCSTGTGVSPSTSRDSLPSAFSNRSPASQDGWRRQSTWGHPRRVSSGGALTGDSPLAVTAKLVALPIMRAFTFLRLSPEMTSPAYQGAWLRFMARMQSNGRRPSVTPAPRLGFRPVAVPRATPGSEWVPPPAPPPRPGSPTSTS